MQNAFRDVFLFPTEVSWYESETGIETKVSGTYDESAENSKESVSFSGYYDRSA